MSTPFQNRLVGTIIVAAAVIIFLPDLLDGKKSMRQTDFDKIPPVPAFTGEKITKPFPNQKLVIKDKVKIHNETSRDHLLKSDSVVQNNGQNDSKTNLKIIKKETKIPTVEKTIVTPSKKVDDIVINSTLKTQNKSTIAKPILGHQPPKSFNKEAWVIQLGSFKHKSNVAELVAKLKRSGYTVFTKPIKTKKGTLTKVCIGPELNKQALMKKLLTLKKLTNVQGKIARFYPIN